MHRWRRGSPALTGADLLTLSLLALHPLPALAQEASDTPGRAPESAAAEAAPEDAGAAEVADIDAAPLLAAEALEDLVAPVALYPDALLAQVLVAATYPLDVVKASRWVEDSAEMAEAERADAADAEGWDPSVAVLAAGFPTVVTAMSDDIDRTELLGDAMLTQSDDVLSAVQRLRARADAMGNLPSNAAQTVTVEGDSITIAPAQPEVVYVPAYDSEAVYTTRASEAPVVVEPSSEGFSTGALVTTGLLSFGAGMLVNELFDDDDHRHGYWRPGHRPVGWGGGGYFRPYPGRPGNIVGNEINVNFDRDLIDIDRNGNWRPDRKRRDRAKDKMADRFGSRGDRFGRPARGDGDRAQLRRKLAAEGGLREGLDKLKRPTRDGGQIAAKLRQNKVGGKLAARKAGDRPSALAKKGDLTRAKQALNRGGLSAAKAKLGDRKGLGGAKPADRKGLGGVRPGDRKGGSGLKLGQAPGGGQKIARPQGGGKPFARKKAGAGPSAFAKRGGDAKAGLGNTRGGKSLRRAEGMRR